MHHTDLETVTPQKVLLVALVTLIIAALTTVTMLSLSGCSSPDQDSSKSATEQSTDDKAQTDDKASGRAVVTDDKSNHENSGQGTDGIMSVDDALAIAFKDAGVKKADATVSKSQLKLEDGVDVYDIEFTTSKGEYEYTLDAKTGEVLDHEFEK